MKASYYTRRTPRPEKDGIFQMKQTKLAIIGAGGYGDYCLGLLERFVDPASFTLVAAIDPFYERVPRYEKLREQFGYTSADFSFYWNDPLY